MSPEVSKKFREMRAVLGLTQAELSLVSGVSLPTIQNLEAGRANPSFDTLISLASHLNLRMEWEIQPCDWNSFAWCGVPVTSDSDGFHPPTQLPTLQNFLFNLRSACFELTQSGNNRDIERKKESVQALLLALKSHFPSIYLKYCSKSKVVNDLFPVQVEGRLIKLRRVALARLAQFL